MEKDIYIIRNKINNKVYIGQSVNAEVRYKAHISNSKTFSRHSEIDEAMSELGIENFYYEIIERTENYNERERYWIKYYNSLIPNGYNILEGGNVKPQHTSIKNEEILLKIIQDIQFSNKSLKTIAEENNLSLKIISSINRGTSYKRDYIYPLRKRDKDSLDSILASQIMKEIISTNNSLRDISKRYNINPSLVRNINDGIIFRDDSLNYPLRDTIKEPDYLNKIIYLLTNSDKSLRKIASEVGVSYSTVQGINSGRYHNNSLFNYPIRSNI